MTEIFALFRNEWIKLFARKGAILLAVLIVLSPIAAGVIAKSVLAAEATPDEANTNLEEEIASLAAEAENAKSRLDTLLDSLYDDSTGEEVYDKIYWAKQQFYYFQTAASFRVPVWSVPFLSSAVSDYALNLVDIELYRTAGDESAAEKEAENALLCRVIQERNYAEYISVLNTRIDKNAALSEGEKQLLKEENLRRLSLDESGAGLSAEAEKLNARISALQKSISYGVDYAHSATEGDFLTRGDRDAIENELAAAVFRLENGYFGNDISFSVMLDAMEKCGMIFLSAFLILLAGRILSGEMRSGSIRFGLIAPVSRNRVFAAKACFLLAIGLIAVLALSIAISVSAPQLLPGKACPYVFAVNGTARSIAFPLFVFLSLLCRFGTAVAFLLFAFFLSAKAQNPAGILAAAAALFCGGRALGFIAQLLFAEKLWYPFLPFQNFDLSSAFFSYGSESAAALPSPLFSLCYQLVLFSVLYLLGRDAFARRDL